MEQLFGNFVFLEGIPAVFLVIMTAATLLYLKEWRGLLVALTVQYLAAGLLFASVLEPEMAGIKLVVGLFVCLILYFGGSQVTWGRNLVDINREAGRTVAIGPMTIAADRLIRSALALAVGAVALIFLPRSEEANLPGTLALAAYGLVALGLVGVGVPERPYKAGLGLLTFLTGFDLLYSALAFSDGLLIFFAAAHLTAALIISYIIQRRYLAAVQQPGE